MIGRQHHMQFFTAGGEKLLQSSHLVEADDGDDGAADEQRRTLQQVRPDHGFEAAVNGVRPGQNANRPDAYVKIDTENGLQADGAGVQHRSQRHADVGHEHVHRHEGARRCTVPVFEELGHGVNAQLQINRQQIQTDHYQGYGGDPFVAGDGQTRRSEAGAGHADEMLRGNIGRDERKTDQPPGEVAAGQEVVFGCVFLAGCVQRNRYHRGDERHESQHIDPG